MSNAGYTDLVNWTVGSEGYSYGFDGMAGYLDHALASSTLLAQTLAANEWHINSDEPAALDYNVENKTTAQQTSLYNPDPYRSTDHDPVLVGLNLATTDDLSDLTGYPVAWHSSNGLKLGATWAAGHSTVGSGTNDGVVRTPGIAWSPASGGSVDVTVNGATGYVTGWIDWNNDGDFGDTGEQILTNEAFTAGQSRTIHVHHPRYSADRGWIRQRFQRPLPRLSDGANRARARGSRAGCCERGAFAERRCDRRRGGGLHLGFRPERSDAAQLRRRELAAINLAGRGRSGAARRGGSDPAPAPVVCYGKSDRFGLGELE